jgi:hypothetical protein
MNNTKEDIYEDNTTNASSSRTSYISATSFESEEEINHAPIDMVIESHSLYHSVV